MGQFSISKPDVLFVSDGERIFKGASQDWYGRRWQRMAGCGPTVASTLAWYLSLTRENCAALSEGGTGDKEDFLRIMNAVWPFVTPGYRGVNSTVILRKGLYEYARQRGIALSFDVLEVELERSARPEWPRLDAFLRGAMERDRPVAFLNLNNGEEKNLDRWHWVTLVAYNTDTGCAVMYDQGKSRSIDMSLWLGTTTLGGGFVAADSADITNISA